MVRANPSGALSSLVFMCKATASWHVRMDYGGKLFQVVQSYFKSSLNQLIKHVMCIRFLVK
ncbi:hypothetical protein ACSBR2_017899 [Camellia fascicularis]